MGCSAQAEWAFGLRGLSRMVRSSKLAVGLRALWPELN